MEIIGFDIGGTKCASIIAEITDDEIKFLQRKEFVTSGTWYQILDRLIAESHADQGSAEAIGISCGGPLDGERGVILSPPNLVGWVNVPIVEYVEQKTGIQTCLFNDADACAIAEWKFGAGKGCRNVIFLTFGTGLGAGLILNGELYSGTCNLAGELGHIRLAPDGPEGYNKKGSFEGFCSGGGIERLSAKYFGETKTAKECAKAANSGDIRALKLFEEVGYRLGQGLAIVIDLLNPEVIVLGGVFMRAHKLMTNAMYSVLESECLMQSLHSVRIVPAQLGEKIGDYGAIVAGMMKS